MKHVWLMLALFAALGAAEGCACTNPVIMPEVSVHVTDSSTAGPLAGAIVTVTPAAGGDPIVLLDRQNGSYESGPGGTAPGLSYEGDYTLRVTLTGFAAYVSTVHLSHVTGGCSNPLIIDVPLTHSAG
ncbi:MAG: carboxypeptidase-like regulatory domain-containing protein [Deltaproteobacteria bacterium]